MDFMLPRNTGVLFFGALVVTSGSKEHSVTTGKETKKKASTLWKTRCNHREHYFTNNVQG